MTLWCMELVSAWMCVGAHDGQNLLFCCICSARGIFIKMDPTWFWPPSPYYNFLEKQISRRTPNAKGLSSKIIFDKSAIEVYDIFQFFLS